MKIFKNKKAFIATIITFIVMYNVFVFLLPFNRVGAFWIGYSFSMLSVLLTGGVWLYVFSNDKLKSRIYGLPLIFIVFGYFVTQLIVGLLEMILTIIPFPIGIVLNIIILGAFLIGLITTNSAKEEIERIDKNINQKVFYLKSLQVNIECLADKVADESAKKSLKDITQVIRYSDPMSSQQLAPIENQIDAKVVDLTEYVNLADVTSIKTMCDDIQQLMEERNRKCQILK